MSPADLCHPTSWREPFTAEGRLFELKHDGFRAFVRKSYGEALFDVVTEHIVGKRLDARYRAGRQPAWRKIKNQRYSRQEGLRWCE